MAKRNNKKSRKYSSPREIGLGIDQDTISDILGVDEGSWHEQTQHIYRKLFRLKAQLMDMSPDQDGYDKLEADFQRHAWYLGFNLDSAKHRFIYGLLLNGRSKIGLGVGASSLTCEHSIRMSMVDQLGLLKAVLIGYERSGGHHEPISRDLDTLADRLASSCYRHANAG